MNKQTTLLVPYSGFTRLRSLKFETFISLVDGDINVKFLLQAPERELQEIKWPSVTGKTGAVRRDELWKSTCLEAFVGDSTSEAYFEFNLAPNRDWNVYRFNSYRAGLTKVFPDANVSPSLEGRVQDGLREAGIQIPVAKLQLLGPVVLGVTAVLEYQDGHKEYWALAHSGEKPDFHLRSSFITNVGFRS